MISIQKRFPADVTLEELTFLNDKKIDAEIYTYFQICSYPKDGETRVYKKDLGTQKEVCEILKTCGSNDVSAASKVFDRKGLRY